MGWRCLSKGELEAQWLMSDGARLEQGFLHGVKIPGTGRSSTIDQWLSEVSFDCKVSYCGNAPAYHTYWFKTEFAAARFQRQWEGKYAQPGEGFTDFT